VAILPFIEGGNVLSLYNKTAFFLDDPANVSFHTATLPFMLCPSDSNGSTPFDATVATSGASPASLGFTSKLGSWARGCYAANAVVNDDVADGNTSTAMQGAFCTGWTMLQKRGVMLNNIACSMKQITDGTSKTVAIAEIRADIGSGAMRGVWALTSGASALYGFGCATQAFAATDGTNPSNDVGPNNPGNSAANGASGDFTGTCSTTNGSVSNAGTGQALVNLGMGCNQSGLGNKQSGPKSTHPGGVQAVFCDGSVHWIDDSIQVGTGSVAMGYWEMLFLSGDGGSLPQDVITN
jgi:prepilin-type processing-associated H-X9-DG protein